MIRNSNVWKAFATGVVLSLIPAAGVRADACKAVEREIVRGTVASEDAKDEAGFLAAAKEFQAAADKAPTCPHAHYNLGLVFEKAGEYAKAIKALKRYLELAPKADDAPAVKRKIYALEYRAEQKTKLAATPAEPKSKWAGLSGKWCVVGAKCGSRVKTQYWDEIVKPFSVTVQGNRISIIHDSPAYNTGFKCTRIQKDTYEGTIEQSGAIRGTWVHDWRFEDHCAPFSRTPPNDTTGTFTGKVAGGGSIIELHADGYSVQSRQRVQIPTNLMRYP